MPKKNSTLLPINLLLICILVGAFLLSACGEFSLDVNLGQADSAEGGISQNSLFLIMGVIFFVIFALVLVSVTSR